MAKNAIFIMLLTLEGFRFNKELSFWSLKWFNHLIQIESKATISHICRNFNLNLCRLKNSFCESVLVNSICLRLTLERMERFYLWKGLSSFNKIFNSFFRIKLCYLREFKILILSLKNFVYLTNQFWSKKNDLRLERSSEVSFEAVLHDKLHLDFGSSKLD